LDVMENSLSVELVPGLITRTVPLMVPSSDGPVSDYSESILDINSAKLSPWTWESPMFMSAMPGLWCGLFPCYVKDSTMVRLSLAGC
jgi:hypothetical protein